MKCWSCKKTLADYPHSKIPFRATCDFCSVYLHCCKNCRFYKPGMANDCMVPGTELIADRQQTNLCEEFSLATETKGSEGPSVEDIEKRLFKD